MIIIERGKSECITIGHCEPELIDVCIADVLETEARVRIILRVPEDWCVELVGTKDRKSGTSDLVG